MGIGFPGDAPRNWVSVLALTTIVPTLAAGAMLGWNPPSGLLVHTRSVVYWFFDLDWFYAALDRTVAQVQRFLRWLYEAIEEMVPLAWAMIWLLGIALYMFQR